MVDFSKAFDLIDHTTLISKLSNVHVPSFVIKWYCSFLTDRKVCTRIRAGPDSNLISLNSQWKDITCGVPQGTKSGPICFLIMINDCLKGAGHVWKYVDDLTIGVSGADAQVQLQETLDHLSAWTEENHMRINTAKTHIFHVSFSRAAQNAPIASIGNDVVKNLSECKILGVTLRNDLRWNKHVCDCVRRASLRLYMLKQLKRSGAPRPEMLQVYSSFIRPVLEYASVIFCSGLPESLSLDIEHVQKRACRVILGQSYCDYEHALSVLGLTTLKERRQSLFKNFANSLNANDRSNILPPKSDSERCLRSAGLHRNVPFSRTERYRRSAVPEITRFLNSLI